jgi:hypothetical protein
MSDAGDDDFARIAAALERIARAHERIAEAVSTSPTSPANPPIGGPTRTRKSPPKLTDVDRAHAIKLARELGFDVRTNRR